MKLKKILFNEKSFTDFDAYAEYLNKWNLELYQISPGKFNGSLKQIILPELIIQKNKTNKSHKINGTAPKGYRNFSIVTKAQAAPLWRGKEMSLDSIAMFPKDGELEGISTDRFESIELAVSNNIIRKMIRYLGLDETKIKLSPDKVFHCKRGTLNELKRFLNAISSECSINSDKLSNDLYINYLQEQTVSKLLKILCLPAKETDFKQSVKRRNALKIFEDVVNNINPEYFTITNLCQYANVSLRTLEYAFQEKYNLTPKQYLRTIKLNNVHKNLLRTHPMERGIASIANEYGFWHMGQFAKDYKNLFGGLPSETLKK